MLMSEMGREDDSIINKLIMIHEALGTIIQDLQQEQTGQGDLFGRSQQEEHPVAAIKKSLLAGIR